MLPKTGAVRFTWRRPEERRCMCPSSRTLDGSSVPKEFWLQENPSLLSTLQAPPAPKPRRSSTGTTDSTSCASSGTFRPSTSRIHFRSKQMQRDPTLDRIQRDALLVEGKAAQVNLAKQGSCSKTPRMDSCSRFQWSACSRMLLGDWPKRIQKFRSNFACLSRWPQATPDGMYRFRECVLQHGG